MKYTREELAQISEEFKRVLRAFNRGLAKRYVDEVIEPAMIQRAHEGERHLNIPYKILREKDFTIDELQEFLGDFKLIYCPNNEVYQIFW